MKVFITEEGSAYSGKSYGITHAFDTEEKAIKYRKNKSIEPENYGMYITITELETE